MMTGASDSHQDTDQATDDKRVARSAVDRKPSPSAEELQYLVNLHLGSHPERHRISPWLIRLVSAALAVLALLLLLALLPELGGTVR
jgi:hypothetical protein